MEQKINTWMEKLKNPAFIVMFLGIWYTFSVTYSNVGVIGQRQNKWIDRQVEMHDEFDTFKEETMERIHQVELSVKDEEIKRKDAEIARLKEE